MLGLITFIFCVCMLFSEKLTPWDLWQSNCQLVAMVFDLEVPESSGRSRLNNELECSAGNWIIYHFLPSCAAPERKKWLPGDMTNWLLFLIDVNVRRFISISLQRVLLHLGNEFCTHKENIQTCRNIAVIFQNSNSIPACAHPVN